MRQEQLQRIQQVVELLVGLIGEVKGDSRDVGVVGPAKYRKWEKSEDRYLLDNDEIGVSIGDIAKDLGRGVNSCHSRLGRLKRGYLMGKR